MQATDLYSRTTTAFRNRACVSVRASADSIDIVTAMRAATSRYSSAMGGGGKMASSCLPHSLLLRLFAIAVLLSAIFLLPAAGVPARSFADLKKLMADPRVGSIEVMANIKLTEGLPVVKRSLRISGRCPRGKLCVIDGGKKFGIFAFNSQRCKGPLPRLTVSVSNLRLINARVHLDFVDYGCGIMQWASGAAITLVDVAMVTVKGVVFEGNEAPGGGGGGGGLSFYGSSGTPLLPFGIPTVVVDNCIFRNNRAAAQGGAVRLYASAKATISSSTFVNNSVTSADEVNIGGGGGALASAFADIKVIGCKFQGNTHSLGRGGAVHAGEFGLGGRVDIQSNTFEGNSAREGGAISVVRTGGSFCKNVFVQNVATVKDGARKGSDNVLVVLDSHPAKFCPRIPANTRAFCVGEYTQDQIRTNAPCSVKDGLRAGCGAGGACLPFGADNRTPTGRLISFLLDEKRTTLTLKEHVSLTEGLPDAFSFGNKPITIVGNCKGSVNRRCVIDGQGKYVAFTFNAPVVMKNLEIRRAALTAVSAHDGLVGESLVFTQNKRPFSDFESVLSAASGLFVSGKFSVSNCTFSQNVGSRGVAVTALSFGTITRGVVSKCTFVNNVASGTAAAIELRGNSEWPASLRVADCAFVGNSAEYSSAIRATYAEVGIVRSAFRNNTASMDNSAIIEIDEYDKFSICNWDFVGNTIAGRNNSNLFLRQTKTRKAKTLFCPSLPPRTVFQCDGEPGACHPSTVGGQGCKLCK